MDTHHRASPISSSSLPLLLFWGWRYFSSSYHQFTRRRPLRHCHALFPPPPLLPPHHHHHNPNGIFFSLLSSSLPFLPFPWKNYDLARQTLATTCNWVLLPNRLWSIKVERQKRLSWLYLEFAQGKCVRTTRTFMFLCILYFT